MTCQSLCSNHNSLAGKVALQDSAAYVSLSSIFNFQRTDIANAMSWTSQLAASGPVECRYQAALLNFAEGRSRSELLRRQRRTALVREVVYSHITQTRQQPNSSFVKLLLHVTEARTDRHHAIQPARSRCSRPPSRVVCLCRCGDQCASRTEAAFAGHFSL